MATGRIDFPQWVRDSFLKHIDDTQPPNIFAMVVPDEELPDPDHMSGMRIWIGNGVSVLCLFAEEDRYKEDLTEDLM